MIVRSLLLVMTFASSTSMAAIQYAEEAAIKIEKSKQKIEGEEIARRKVLGALYELNRKLRRNMNKKTKLRYEKIGLQENIRRITTKLNELESESSAMKTQLSERLRTMHRLGGASIVRILFSANSPSQLERNLRILGTLSSRDRDVIKEYQTIAKNISEKKEQLTARFEKLSETEKLLKSKEGRYLSDIELKNKILKGIRKKHLFALNNLQKLKSETRDAGFQDDLLEAVLRPSFSEQKGILLSPLANNNVIRDFGVENAGKNSWTIVHKGVRFSAQRGDSVRSVFDGKVAWVGSFKNEGETVIIDHGDHYFTVYSELEKIKVNEGQSIKQGELIAQVGHSVLEDEPGLHFEIRHFSEPDDPMEWMKGNVL